MHRYGSKRIRDIRDVLAAFPVSGWLWLCGAVAITGAPPFGLFLSEFTILRAGWAGPNLWAAIVMLLLLIVIFIAFLNHFRAMYLESPSTPISQLEVSDIAWRTWPMALALAPLLVLGVWWPSAWTALYQHIAAGLGAMP